MDEPIPTRSTLPPLPQFGTAPSPPGSSNPDEPLPWLSTEEPEEAPATPAPRRRLPGRHPLETIPVPFDGLDYTRVLTPLSKRWGRFLLSGATVLSFPLMFAGLLLALLIVIFAMDMAGGPTPEGFESNTWMSSVLLGTPGLIMVAIAWALQTLACVASLTVYGDTAHRYLWSVAGRLRWRWLGISLAVAAVTIPIPTLVTIAWLHNWQPLTPDYTALAVSIVAGVIIGIGVETLRGWLLMHVGSWLAPPLSKWLSIGIAALIIAAVLGWITGFVFLGYLVIGCGAGWLTERTGGVESSMAMSIMFAVSSHVGWSLYGIPNHGMFPNHAGVGLDPQMVLLAQVAATVLVLGLLSRRLQRVTGTRTASARVPG